MAAVKVTKPVDEVDDDSMPEWKRLSIERSLQGPRARAQERTDRFVGAAMELMAERGSIDFTVQDVVDRSKMSIRTFYNFFASKDDLLVAVHETILATEVVPRMRAKCEAESDPIARVRAYVEGIYDLTSNPGPAAGRSRPTATGCSKPDPRTSNEPSGRRSTSSSSSFETPRRLAGCTPPSARRRRHICCTTPSSQRSTHESSGPMGRIASAPPISGPSAPRAWA